MLCTSKKKKNGREHEIHQGQRQVKQKKYVEAEIDNMKHKRGTIQRLAVDRDKWR